MTCNREIVCRFVLPSLLCVFSVITSVTKSSAQGQVEEHEVRAELLETQESIASNRSEPLTRRILAIRTIRAIALGEHTKVDRNLTAEALEVLSRLTDRRLIAEVAEAVGEIVDKSSELLSDPEYEAAISYLERTGVDSTVGFIAQGVAAASLSDALTNSKVANDKPTRFPQVVESQQTIAESSTSDPLVRLAATTSLASKAASLRDNPESNIAGLRAVLEAKEKADSAATAAKNDLDAKKVDEATKQGAAKTAREAATAATPTQPALEAAAMQAEAEAAAAQDAVAEAEEKKEAADSAARVAADAADLVTAGVPVAAGAALRTIVRALNNIVDSANLPTPVAETAWAALQGYLTPAASAPPEENQTASASATDPPDLTGQPLAATARPMATGLPMATERLGVSQTRQFDPARDALSGKRKFRDDLLPSTPDAVRKARAVGATRAAGASGLPFQPADVTQ